MRRNLRWGDLTMKLSTLRGRLAAFTAADRGAIAVQAAFLIAPIAVLAFGMVDVNRASIGKKNLQDALDAATLMTARSNAVAAEDIQSVGAAALNGQLQGQLDDATLSSATFTSDGTTIHGAATLSVAPVVANLWLQSNMTVGARSDVVRSVNKLEIAMVLDNTGSMAGSKLSNLKTAANDFIDQLAAAAARSSETNPVKIGIVPFSNAVRLASATADINAYKAAAWMDAAGNAPASKEIFYNNPAINRFTLLSNLGLSWGGCVESRAAPYDVQDTAPTSAAPATLFTPYFWPDEADNDSDEVNHYLDDDEGSGWSWQRRQGNTAKYDHTISASTSSGPNKGCNMQPISRLSTDWTALKAKVTAMNAVGETHIPLGMAWGWHLLTPNAPFADGKPYGTANNTKVVVLMTDGDNTYSVNSSNNRSNYDGYGFIWQGRAGTTSNTHSTRQDAIDDRLALICTNMKAAGIVIYTVRVEVTTGSSSLLQNCATRPDMFYDVQSASNLTAVFSAIAGSIQNLRISA
jgi:Flp pilus assembly protein TadG